MSRSFVVRLSGDKDLEAAFNALALSAQKKVFRPALRVGGKVLLQAILARVPRKTGNLARSIKLRAGKRSRQGISVAVFVDKSILKTRVSHNKLTGQTKEFFHPAHVELGYVRRTKKGTFVIPPHSFIRAGFDESKDRALQAIEAEVGRRMEAIYGNPKVASSLTEGED